MHPYTTIQKEKEYASNRMQFGSNFEFLAATLGFACGFGSVWRFPYLVFKNGGGAFMIPYLILLFTLAIPMFFLEISLGQIHRVCLPQILARIDPKYKGFGYIGTYLAGNISSYYNLLMAYSLYYFFQSFRYPLPWNEKLKKGEVWSAAYFYEDVIALSPDIMTLGNLQIGLYSCYLMCQGLVFLCIRGGVELSGRVAMYTATAPYLILTILLIRGAFLPGASQGIYYLLIPNFEKLFSPHVWVDAANQVIFQMSLGLGALTAYGSYRKKTDQLNVFCVGIPLLTMCCGIIGAFVVFCYMGHISYVSNIPINDIPLSGPELAFVIYPAALSKMFLANLWSVLFFIVMILLGIDSQFGFMDTISGTIEDAYLGEFSLFGRNLSGEQIRLMVCSIVAVSGLLYCNQAGLYFLELVDVSTTTLPFMMMFLFQIYFFCLQGDQFDKLCEKLELNGTPMPKLIKFMLTSVVSKLLIGLTILAIYSQIKHSLQYPWPMQVFYWTIVLIPFAIVYKFYKENLNSSPITMDNHQEMSLIQK